MATLGEELKAARESRGMTLEQIADTTRISHTFLKALEENDYDVIPGEVFVIGFLRTYARELGLDEKQVLARYREAHPVQKEEQQPELVGGTEQKIKPALRKLGAGFAAKKKSPVYLIILGGLLLGALLTGITVLLTPKETTYAPPPEKPASAPTPVPQQPAVNATTFHPVTTAARPSAPCPPARVSTFRPMTTARSPRKAPSTSARKNIYKPITSHRPRKSPSPKAGAAFPLRTSKARR